MALYSLDFLQLSFSSVIPLEMVMGYASYFYAETKTWSPERWFWVSRAWFGCWLGGGGVERGEF